MASLSIALLKKSKVIDPSPVLNSRLKMLLFLKWLSQ